MWPIMRKLRIVTSVPPDSVKHAPSPSLMSSTVSTALAPSMAIAAAFRHPDAVRQPVVARRDMDVALLL